MISNLIKTGQTAKKQTNIYSLKVLPKVTALKVGYTAQFLT